MRWTPLLTQAAIVGPFEAAAAVATAAVTAGGAYLIARLNKTGAGDGGPVAATNQTAADEWQAAVLDIHRRLVLVEHEVTMLRAWRASATAYIHTLRDALDRAGQRIPAPPEDLDLT